MLGIRSLNDLENFVLHPQEHCTSKPEKITATALNVLLGIATLGTVHIGFFMKHWLTPDEPTDQRNSTQSPENLLSKLHVTNRFCRLEIEKAQTKITSNSILSPALSDETFSTVVDYFDDLARMEFSKRPDSQASLHFCRAATLAHQVEAILKTSDFKENPALLPTISSMRKELQIAKKAFEKQDIAAQEKSHHQIILLSLDSLALRLKSLYRPPIQID